MLFLIPAPALPRSGSARSYPPVFRPHHVIQLEQHREYARAGLAPEFATRSALNDPPVPGFTLVLPAATGFASAVVNAGHETSTTPDAGVEFAR